MAIRLACRNDANMLSALRKDHDQDSTQRVHAKGNASILHRMAVRNREGILVRKHGRCISKIDTVFATIGTGFRCTVSYS